MTEPISIDRYRDLDPTFSKNPFTKDITSPNQETCIKTSLKNLVMTNFGERKFRPDIGSRISAMLFENGNSMVYNLIGDEIATTISNFEPRVTLLGVTINESEANKNALGVVIRYRINNTQITSTLDFFLSRLR
jgi:hypothetical protein